MGTGSRWGGEKRRLGLGKDGGCVFYVLRSLFVGSGRVGGGF